MAKRFSDSFSLIVVTFAVVVFELSETAAAVPAVFILGDSTADVGTNNYLPESTARADFPFNGIDFPHSRPTGRFSNGLNSADFLAKLMGYKRSPAPFFSFMNHTSSNLNKKIIRGVNFASGGSGLLDITGQSMKVITLGEQINQFASIRSNIMNAMGEASTKELLSKAVIFISIGSNDLFGYYYSNSTSPIQEFIGTLGMTYEIHLKKLIELGARKFGIISVPPIGCCPSQRVMNSTGGCLEALNDYARDFHSTLDALMRKLSSENEGIKYSLGNAYEMTINVIQNPAAFNLKEVKTACCGAGKFNGEAICDPKAHLCSNTNRKEYLFWDLYHPTQVASKLAALTLYGGGPPFVSPINFSQLANDN